MANEAETPYVPAEHWCPDCQGPPVNERAALVYCPVHMPPDRGHADTDTNFPIISTWSAEAGGVFNQQMCDAVHRKEFVK